MISSNLIFHGINSKTPTICKRLSVCKSWELSLYHLKILQRFHNRILFFLRTLGLFGVFRFRLIVIFLLDDAVLLLHLRNIEVGHLQLVVFPHIIPDRFVGGLTLGDSHVQFVHAMSRSAVVSCNYHRFPDRNSFAPPAEQPLAFCLNYPEFPDSCPPCLSFPPSSPCKRKS